jgi:hypothetical protein
LFCFVLGSQRATMPPSEASLCTSIFIHYT